MGLQAAVISALVPFASGLVEVGVLDANRGSADLQAIVGCLFDIVPLRVEVSGDVTAREMIGRVREASLCAQSNRIPLGALHQLSETEEEGQAQSAYEVTINIIPSAVQDLRPRRVMTRSGTLEIRPQAFRYEQLVLTADWSYIGQVLEFGFTMDRTGWLLGAVEGNVRVLAVETLGAIAERLPRLLRAMVLHPDSPLDSLLSARVAA
jgi:hypothetical protein